MECTIDKTDKENVYMNSYEVLEWLHIYQRSRKPSTQALIIRSDFKVFAYTIDPKNNNTYQNYTHTRYWITTYLTNASMEIISMGLRSIVNIKRIFYGSKA